MYCSYVLCKYYAYTYIMYHAYVSIIFMVCFVPLRPEYYVHLATLLLAYVNLQLCNKQY